ncbi:DUF6600 domain-containing protein [Variovorax sp. RA8]|uniref:DUF6600 domain-containing protein n=1 Tax=Variovorax sp. (strain JCM 16519 / RA8) TaxID=662548 RepID=UPI00131913D1|nr:DUF6600 domain-containing protein [Variovorax sp. RA8]VTU15040.1 Ornithine/acetylornithine aminotransferase [Variovorax sp. RA8]
MKHRTTSHGARRAVGWLLGLVLLLAAGAAAWAQQDPPGRVARLDEQQGTVSFSPAGDDSWYDAVPNRPITTGDRLWTDRNARAELHVDSTALRLDDQTMLVVSELEDDSARFTATRGRLQLRVREAPAGQRLEIDTANLAVVVEAPGDYRIEVDPAAGTTRVAVAAGGLTLYGENGESVALGAHQQLTVSGRQLAAVSSTPVRAGDAFDRWVAERDRLEDQSISARYVSRDVLGYQQLDRYGDWQSDPTYGNVWYPRSVDADWAPYRDGQWVDIAPWGWTWVDAAPWGFAPSHYGRWARIGPRWAWVPGRANTRPVYAPALVGFVGGGVHANVAAGGRPGVGWFPLAPGEPWRPGYRASQRYIDEANRAVAYQRQLARADYLHRNTPGALSLVPVDIFGRGPIARRDFLRTPEGATAQLPIVATAPIPARGDRHVGGFGRSASALPPPDLRGRQQQFQQAQQLQQAQQAHQAQQAQQQLQFQQRAVQAQAQAQQQLQLQQMQRFQQMQQAQQPQSGQQLQQMQQRDALRQQQEFQQRAAQAQAQQQFQLQQQQQQQQALRAQQEMQQRAAQAQAQQLQLVQQQQALRAQQQMQAQQQIQQMQMQQQNTLRQAQEHQQRALQQQQQQQQRAGGSDPRQRWTSRDSGPQFDRP